MSHLIYQASQARIDNLLRDAGDRRRATAAGVRPDARPSQMLRRPQHGLRRVRRVLLGANSRPATR